jgi:hypothetical protein
MIDGLRGFEMEEIRSRGGSAGPIESASIYQQVNDNIYLAANLMLLLTVVGIIVSPFLYN